ncbi:MAG: hydroxyacid dehydrogenase [Bdellovibrionales bacterium]|nr:hydroxyacid dehydrogenase [Bdellovibrionales bacterium]
MKKYRILVSDAVDQEGLQNLMKIDEFDVVDGSKWDREKLLQEIKGFHGLVVRSSTQVDQALLEQASAMRVVCRAGTGVDNIDVTYAKQKNIVVMNTPGTNAQAAAELTLGLMLTMVRDIPNAISSLKNGQWDRKKWVGSELHQKTLGIIGLGNIGQRVGMMAHAFGMKVVCFDPYQKQTHATPFSMEMVDVDVLWMRSDFITLHATLTDQTRNLICEKTIQKMKKGVYIINCARAELLNTKDVLQGLESGQVAGLALDVLDQEPPPENHPFLHHPHVWVTPHIGASTKEAQSNVMGQTLFQLQSFFLSNNVLHAL